ncbi:MAG: thermonuclease family protein [Pirellulales bacterium]|nr:thermonuclease family protein [Pirellulales bacterium]
MRFPHRRPRRGLWLLAAVVALVVYRLATTGGDNEAPEALAEGNYEVARVVDGDTLLLANHARVRLIGVDTPETVRPNHPVEPWGPEASRFTREFLGSGSVRLTFDHERKDKFERFLAYVWVGDRLLNEELLRAGFARAELGFHYSGAMKKRFREAERSAQRERLGLWSGRP